MSFAHQLGQIWILIPAALILVSGFAVTLRSVDVPTGSAQGVRQMVSNLSYTVASVALIVAVLLLMQGIVGYNLKATW